jgi:leucyl/phenylalanyl-tRNA--protein transferase
MIFRLTDEYVFPDPSLAEEDGLLAVGGDLRPDRIVAAYTQGIFPWFSPGDPILWWSPDPRLVLFPDNFKISSSLRQTLKSEVYTVTFDSCFEEVIRQCSLTRRKDQKGTWITAAMIRAYTQLHKLGYGHSVETWHRDQLVGGLYGLSIGKVFFGESMFYNEKDASKVALASLVDKLKAEEYHLIDCQMTTQHLLSLGATEISRESYLKLLHSGIK